MVSGSWDRAQGSSLSRESAGNSLSHSPSATPPTRSLSCKKKKKEKERKKKMHRWKDRYMINQVQQNVNDRIQVVGTWY